MANKRDLFGKQLIQNAATQLRLSQKSSTWVNFASVSIRQKVGLEAFGWTV